MTDTTPLDRPALHRTSRRVSTRPQPNQPARWDRAHPPILTHQETQVLAEAAGGYSNRGIADALHVSRKTVEAHLSSVFLKLGISPRPDRNQRVCAVLYWTTALAPPSTATGLTEWSSMSLRYWT